MWRIMVRINVRDENELMDIIMIIGIIWIIKKCISGGCQS